MDSVTAQKVSNHIHDDLAFFILSKLPLKPLKRSSCVHKSWSHLFENPNFTNMYRNYFISSTCEEDGSCLLLQQTLYFPNLHHVCHTPNFDQLEIFHSNFKVYSYFNNQNRCFILYAFFLLFVLKYLNILFVPLIVKIFLAVS